MRSHNPLCSYAAITLVTFLGVRCVDEILYTPPPEYWIVFTQENSGLTNNNVHSIAITNDRIVLFGTDSGVSALRSGAWSFIIDSVTTFQTYYDSTGEVDTVIVLSRSVTSIAEDAEGYLWYGLWFGVRRYDRVHGTWQRHDTSLLYSRVNCIGASRACRSDVWVGTFLGANRFIPDSLHPGEGQWLKYTWEHTPQILSVSALGFNFLDHSVMIGTNGAIVYYNEDRGWREYWFPPRYNRRVMSIAFDPISNTGWFAKEEGVTGFNFSTGDVYHYDDKNTSGGLPSGSVNAAVHDKQRTLWFGTNHGLVSFSSNAWERFSRDNSPLPSDTINALAIDWRGNVWIGTPRGAAVFNPKGVRL